MWSDPEINRECRKKLRRNRYRRFLVRLSLKWGIPVHQILSRFTGDEIKELQALEYLEPWGYEIENHRAALPAYITACAHSEQDKTPDYGTFLREWFGDREREEPEKPHEDKVIDFVKASVLATGGMVV